MEDEDGYMSDQDIFAEEDSQTSLNFRSPKTPVGPKQDSAEVSRLRGLMGGIPPPPEKTNPQIDIPAMLEAWKTNVELHWGGVPQKEDTSVQPKVAKRKPELITNKDLKPSRLETDETSPESECETENDEQKRFDIYLNKDTEEEEILRLKVAARLISSETSSSFVPHVLLSNSAKKRQRRNGWAKSPGSRLSYLAKRRTTFSQRPNLSNQRTISILKEDKKPSKDKKSNPLKRALFQSPDKLDFSTPDCRLKRLKLSVPSPSNRGTPPRRNDRLSSVGSSLKHKPTVSRNLESAFNSFVAQSNPDLLNSRQKQLWQRTPLASLPST